jgi:lipopolysaccharide transport system ATP-binding protein
MGVATADDVVFELIYHSAAPSPLRGIKATLGIYDALGRAVTFLENTATMVDLTASPGQGSFRCKVPRLPLPAGRYYVNYHLDHRGDLLDWVQQATWFEVFGGDFFGTGKLTFTGLGGVFVPQVWDGTPSTAMNEPASIPGRNSKP